LPRRVSGEDTVRLSLGLEDIRDLLADLDQAPAAV
jgi:O-acetylhomoserine/O-acetylserine sulfhydrylase-like pyridoxal-dependent enzyme